MCNAERPPSLYESTVHLVFEDEAHVPEIESILLVQSSHSSKFVSFIKVRLTARPWRSLIAIAKSWRVTETSVLLWTTFWLRKRNF